MRSDLLPFAPGETLYTIGLNMACEKVVTRVKFVRNCADGRVAVKAGGITVLCGSQDLYRSRCDCANSIN